MLKYKGYTIAFQEVPNEISLVINVSGCPHYCTNCHSQYLWDNDGAMPLYDNLPSLIEQYLDMITCVCFMGGDWDIDDLAACLKLIKKQYPNIKTCLYNGADVPLSSLSYLHLLDYVKIGSYQIDKGGLNNPKTNQRFYKIQENTVKDITYLFWKKHND